MQLRGGRRSDSREEEAEDVNKERLASDKEDVGAFVSLLSKGGPQGAVIRHMFMHIFRILSNL